jgi:preprotein translocase subunit SecA
MGLLQTWRETAYSTEVTKQESDKFWANYFEIEKGIYEKILSRKTPVKGTVAELAEKFNTDIMIMVGFLDGINDSLKKPNPIDEMTEETEVSLAFDKEKLYYNMVEAKAPWLYELPQWEELLTKERRAQLYKEQKNSGTVRREKKIGRNDPCPCGSGKKYKFCCLNKKS